MKRSYRRWAAGLLALTLILLTAAAAFNWAVDPCFLYRLPDRWRPVFFNERYQDAGLARNCPADTALVGTSMVANYRVGQVAAAYGGTAVKLTIPDGYFSEFDKVLSVLWRHDAPKRIVFSLDINILIRDESGRTAEMPDYLYDENPLNDLRYLLNKDTLYYSAYTLLANRRGTASTLDEAFTWDGTVGWSKETALAGYKRPAAAAETARTDLYFANADANLAILDRWIADHPDTEFDLFFPPYSILYWDKMQRQGDLDATFAAVERVMDDLLRQENVRLYFFASDRDIVTNLNNYCDYIHHSGKVCSRILELLQTDEYRVTPDNAGKLLEDWHKFVADYDYDSIWTTG